MSKNLQKGLETCGLSPVNRQYVLKQLPVHDKNTESSSFLNDAVMEILQQPNSKSISRGQKRGNKVAVTSGKHICLPEICNEATPSTLQSTTAELPAENAETSDSDDNVHDSS